jgi:hypothetical protein
MSDIQWGYGRRLGALALNTRIVPIIFVMAALIAVPLADRPMSIDVLAA